MGLFWNKTEEQQSSIPDEVALAMTVLSMFEGRPGRETVKKAKTIESGSSFDSQQHWESEGTYLKRPVPLTKEQKDLQAVACLVLNQYLTDYMLPPSSEDV